MSYPQFKTVSSLKEEISNHNDKVNKLSSDGWVIISGLICNDTHVYTAMIYDETHPITRRVLDSKKDLPKVTKVKPIGEA